MKKYSHWYLVDCEDMGTITAHCRGCLTSPCSLESLAYVLCPVIDVNLRSLQSAVHFHFQADQLYFVYSQTRVSPCSFSIQSQTQGPLLHLATDSSSVQKPQSHKVYKGGSGHCYSVRQHNSVLMRHRSRASLGRMCFLVTVQKFKVVACDQP